MTVSFESGDLVIPNTAVVGQRRRHPVKLSNPRTSQKRTPLASLSLSEGRQPLLGTVSNGATRVLHLARQIHPTAKHLACGAISAIVSRTIVAPLERIKMEVLLNSHHRNRWRVAVAHLWTSGGLRNFWRGNLLNCIRTAPFKAVNYTVFDLLNKVICTRTSRTEHGYERFIAGAGAGISATITCFPLDVLRTRMMTPGHQKSVFSTAADMFLLEGPGSFYTGCLPAIVSMALGGAVFYGTYDLLKAQSMRRHGKDPRERESGEHRMRLGTMETLVFGATAGMCAEAVTYPFEVLRRKMQLERVLASRELGRNTGATTAYVVNARLSARVSNAFRMITKVNGVRGLYAGMAPNALQVLPSAALGYYIYEVARVILDVRE